MGGSGLDLDSVPPASDSTENSWTDLMARYEDEMRPDGGTISEWPESTAPAPDQCRERVATHEADSIFPEPGGFICVVTDDDRPAVIEILDVDGDYVTAHATIWESE